MKKIKFLFFIVMALSFAACDQLTEGTQDEGMTKKDSLQQSNNKKDSVINEMLGEFNRIRDNLKEIRGKESDIQLKAIKEGEVEDVRASIRADVDRINELMKKNDEIIAKLNKRLDASQIEMREFKRLIANLNAEVKNKNDEIARLNRILQQKELRLDSMFYRLDSMNVENKAQKKKLEEKIDEINKGYFAYGTYKELRDKNVITKEGGFLGLGKSETLKDNFNQEYFNEVDIRNQQSFLIYADEAELVTTHPKSSYKFMGKDKVDSLVITDPEAFWKASKYMVVVVD